MAVRNEKGGIFAEELLYRLSQCTGSRKEKRRVYEHIFIFGFKFLRKKMYVIFCENPTAEICD